MTMPFPAAGDPAWAGTGGIPGSTLNGFLSALVQIYTGSADVDPGSISGNSYTTFEIPISAATEGMPVQIAPPATIEAGLVWNGISHAGVSGGADHTDNFSSYDSAYWATDSPNGSATAAVTSGVMRVTMPSSATSASHAGFQTQASTNNLTSSSIQVKVPATFATTTSAQTVLEACTTGFNNGVQMLKEGTTLRARKIVSGTYTNVGSSVTWNATTMLYWRIRESGGTTYWDYSADASSWTNLTSTANPVSMTSFMFRIYGYCFQNETSAGTSDFDDFIYDTTSALAAGVTVRLSNITTSSINPANGHWTAVISAI